jgi:hypothetical protein
MFKSFVRSIKCLISSDKISNIVTPSHQILQKLQKLHHQIFSQYGIKIYKRNGVTRFDALADDHHHYHQPFNVPTAGIQAFLMDYT